MQNLFETLKIVLSENTEQFDEISSYTPNIKGVAN